MRSLLATVYLICGLLGCRQTLHAQSLPVISEFLETTPTNFVNAMGLGDVNGDGKDDFALGLFHQSFVSAGLVFFSSDAVLVSGSDGALIADFQPAASPPVAVASVYPCGDLDGDMRAEFLTIGQVQSSTGTTNISVWSGASLVPIYSVPFASTSVIISGSAALGDLDGDGIREIALATSQRASINSGQGQIDILSGATGAVLFSIGAPTLQSNGVGDVGDIDGDGTSDFFLSQTNGSNLFTGPYNAGKLEIYSGATRTIIRTIRGTYSTQGLGYRAFSLSDLDNDGNRDILSFSIDDGPSLPSQNSLYQVFSSKTGNLIWSVPSPGGFNVVDFTVIGDINGDGIEDFATSLLVSGTASTFRELRSGADGSILESLPFSVFAPGAVVGPLRSDAFVGDLNGDGIADRIEHQITNTGTVKVTAHTKLGSHIYGKSPATSLSLVRKAVASRPRIGSIEMSGAAPFSSLIMVVSFAPDVATIGGTTFPLLVSVAPQDLILVTNLMANASGFFRSPLNLNSPAIAGTVVYVQGFESSPSPAVSNGLEILFGE